MWCSEASCRSNGCKSHQQRSPVTVVVIPSSGEGDRAAESLEVKGAVGWETGQIRTGRRATWQAVANERTVEASKLFHPRETDCGNIGSAEPLTLWRRPTSTSLFWNLRMSELLGVLGDGMSGR